MRHLNKGNKLSRETSHRKAMLLSMCKALIEHGRITTTIAKAKELRSGTEQAIDILKKGEYMDDGKLRAEPFYNPYL